jgi:fukutin-related protein
MPCTPETERCPDGMRYRRQTPECCLQHQRDIMDHIAEVCREGGVRWWMDYGTLLGAVRNPILGHEPGIIPHDKDGDLGLHGEDWDRLLDARPDVPWSPQKSPGGKPNRIRTLDGFQWTHKLERQSGPGRVRLFTAGWSIKVRRSPKNHVNVDLFPWWPDGERVYRRKRYVGCDRFKGREFPEEKLLPLRTLEWEGRDLPAPADPEWFCEHRYGETWMTPIKRNNEGKRVPDGFKVEAV